MLSSNNQRFKYLNNLEQLTPASKYYSQTQVEQAIHALKQWYIDQQFDDDDFNNDWIPNDYENCDGIHIFTKHLNFSHQENNDANKRILFNWICYWLLPNLNEPAKEPISLKPFQYSETNSSNDTESEEIKQAPSKEVEQIAHQLVQLIKIRFYQTIDPQEAQKIGNFFTEFSTNQGVNLYSHNHMISNFCYLF